MSILRATPRFISLLVLVSLILGGCGFFGQSSAPAEESGEVTTVNGEVSSYSDADEVMEEAPVEESPAEEREVVVEAVKEVESSVGVAEGGDDSAAGEKAEMAPAPAPAATASPAPTASIVEVEAEEAVEADRAELSTAVEIQQAEPLRAGEVDDNAQWDDYLLYRRDYYGPPVHNRDVSERYVIEVIDGQGNPILGATVRVFVAGQQQRQEVYSAQTYANGQTLFHPLALDLPVEQADRFTVEVQKDNLLEQFTLTRFDAQTATSFTERWTVRLDSRNSYDSLNLDVLFLIDATGSMADEIAKIQSTIFDVAARIDALPGQPNVRYGMVTYRDRGDSFISNTYEFTPDVRDFHRDLSSVYADGGGDYPESLNEGLHNALHSVEWRGADTVQLVFLIADAPPHLDYAQDYDYAVEMENAARRGVKIFPIASSGLDDQGEYIFRQIAQYTQGRFIFLTYEGPTNSGSPGDVTTHHVDSYSVSNLDDLLVRLVTEELAYQSPMLVQVE